MRTTLFSESKRRYNLHISPSNWTKKLNFKHAMQLLILHRVAQKENNFYTFWPQHTLSPKFGHNWILIWNHSHWKHQIRQLNIPSALPKFDRVCSVLSWGKWRCQICILISFVTPSSSPSPTSKSIWYSGVGMNSDQNSYMLKFGWGGEEE